MLTIHALHIPEPIPYQRLIFSGGEVQVRINSQRNFIQATIKVHIRSSDDLMELLLITDALRRQGCKELSLVMPYIPYARQDRVCVWGEALSIKVFADLINAQHYEEIEVWDPHSDVATALLNNIRYTVPCLDFVAKIPLDMANITLVAPDAGAAKKVMTVSQKLGAHFLQATKIRDANTGEITGTDIQGVLLASAHYLIVDDICDGGRTFIELAKVLKQAAPAIIDLYVTHGIFSKGFAVFDSLIDTIYCANPWPPLFEAHNRIKV